MYSELFELSLADIPTLSNIYFDEKSKREEDELQRIMTFHYRSVSWQRGTLLVRSSLSFWPPCS